MRVGSSRSASTTVGDSSPADGSAPSAHAEISIVALMAAPYLAVPGLLIRKPLVPWVARIARNLFVARARDVSADIRSWRNPCARGANACTRGAIHALPGSRSDLRRLAPEPKVLDDPAR